MYNRLKERTPNCLTLPIPLFGTNYLYKLKQNGFQFKPIWRMQDAIPAITGLAVVERITDGWI
jgi:hypothetical protein